MKIRLITKAIVMVLVLALLSVLIVACGDGGETPATQAPDGEATQAPDDGASQAPDGEASQAPDGESQVPPSDRHYILASSHQAHPYFEDSHIGLRYAAEQFGVTIEAVGPEEWDTTAQREAMEQTISSMPAGIITRQYDAQSNEAIKKAMELGIPVITTEADIDNNNALAYIGLDNYVCGEDTAKELVNVAGDSGKVAIMGNWGATNTDDKLRGIKDYLAANTNWEVVAEADDKANTNDAITAAKTILTNNADVDAILGIDSSSGAGIQLAMEELNIQAGTYKVVVHDREEPTLEGIQQGYIDSTLINKTAGQEYVAILLMEDWNTGGLKDIPISSDNAAAGVNPLPEKMYNTAVIINKDNVEYFLRANLPSIETDKYNR